MMLGGVFLFEGFYYHLGMTIGLGLDVLIISADNMWFLSAAGRHRRVLSRRIRMGGLVGCNCCYTGIGLEQAYDL